MHKNRDLSTIVREMKITVNKNKTTKRLLRRK